MFGSTSRRPRVALVALAALIAAAITLGGGTASGAAPVGLAYGGETSQHDQAFFLLSTTRRSIKRIALDWHGTCGGVDDEFDVNATFGVVHVKPDGRFAKIQPTTEEGEKPTWSDHWTEQISGRVTGDRVSGSFHGHLVTRRGDGSVVTKCDSGAVTFTAVQ
jgi:hypothetical protein